MKTLANCKPTEFLKQTARIKHSAEKWMKATDIMNIRSTKPVIPEGATKEEKEALIKKQAKENLSRALDAIMEKNPDETLELLALCCFVEPEDIDNHPIREYLAAVNELIADEAVVGFFVSFTQLEQIIT